MPHNEIPVNHDRSWQDVSLWKKKKENRFHVVYEKNDLRYECNVNYDLCDCMNATIIHYVAVLYNSLGIELWMLVRRKVILFSSFWGLTRYRCIGLFDRKLWLAGVEGRTWSAVIQEVPLSPWKKQQPRLQTWRMPLESPKPP